jgi:hypothetical protein
VRTLYLGDLGLDCRASCVGEIGGSLARVCPRQDDADIIAVWEIHAGELVPAGGGWRCHVCLAGVDAEVKAAIYLVDADLGGFGL